LAPAFLSGSALSSRSALFAVTAGNPLPSELFVRYPFFPFPAGNSVLSIITGFLELLGFLAKNKFLARWNIFQLLA